MLKSLFQTPKPPKRVVLLGSSGFIGKALATHLISQKVDVIGISSREIDLSSPSSVEKLKEQIRSEDSVVYLAAITPDKGKDTKTLMKNLVMAQNVSTWLEQASVAHFVHVSSDAVYDFSHHLISEKTAASPSDLYGLMHFSREMMIKTAVQKSKSPLAILRPCSIFGPSDTHNSYGPNRYMKAGLQDYKISLFGRGEEKRDHIFIDDVIQLISLSLFYRSEGLLNLVSGTSWTFYEVAEAVGKAIKKLRNQQVEIYCQPRADSNITYRYFDHSAVIQTFPLFRFTSLESGLEKMAKSLMSF